MDRLVEVLVILGVMAVVLVAIIGLGTIISWFGGPDDDPY